MILELSNALHDVVHGNVGVLQYGGQYGIALHSMIPWYCVGQDRTGFGKQSTVQ